MRIVTARATAIIAALAVLTTVSGCARNRAGGKANTAYIAEAQQMNQQFTAQIRQEVTAYLAKHPELVNKAAPACKTRRHLTQKLAYSTLDWKLARSNRSDSCQIPP